MQSDPDLKKEFDILHRSLWVIVSLIGIFACVCLYVMIDPNFTAFLDEPQPDYASIPEDLDDTIENGIHLRTGLVEADGLMEVVNNCTNCHSAALVIQNRMNKERWEATIDWMQATQNLWDLGKNEEIIVNYLVTNYPPVEKGRRQNLTNIQWYELED